MASVSLFKPTVVRNGKREKTNVWWMAWRDPQSRRLRRKTTETKNKKAAKQVAREQEEKLFQVARGNYDPTEEHRDKTWDEAVAEFLEQSKVRHRPETTVVYEFSLSHFKRLVNLDLLREIAVRSIEDFVVRRSREAGPQTVNRDLRHLKAFLRWAKRLNYLSSVPDFAGIMLRADIGDPVRIPDADVKAVMQALKSSDLKLTMRPAAWWRVFFQIALFTGMRRGEILSLTWDRVNFETGTIVVRCTTSKGRRDRSFESAFDLTKALREWYESHPEPPNPTDPVLPWPYNTYRQLYFDWHRILTAAGIPEERSFVPHDCRSTVASQLLEEHSSLVVRDWLGHSTIATTERYYANTKRARKRVASKRKVVR